MNDTLKLIYKQYISKALVLYKKIQQPESYDILCFGAPCCKNIKAIFYLHAEQMFEN